MLNSGPSLADTCRFGRATRNPRHLSTLSPNPPVDPRDCLLWDTLTRCFHFSPRNRANFSVLFDCDRGGKGSPILQFPPLSCHPVLDGLLPLGSVWSAAKSRVPDLFSTWADRRIAIVPVRLPLEKVDLGRWTAPQLRLWGSRHLSPRRSEAEKRLVLT